MRKEEMKVLDYLLEVLTILLLAGYLVLQILFCLTYGVTFSAVLYRFGAVLLIFLAVLLAQFYPELINIGSREPLKGQVRFLAVRMLRWFKAILMAALIFPSITDLLGRRISSVWGIGAVLLMLFDIVWYMYHIYLYNKNSDNKKD